MMIAAGDDGVDASFDSYRMLASRACVCYEALVDYGHTDGAARLSLRQVAEMAGAALGSPGRTPPSLAQIEHVTAVFTWKLFADRAVTAAQPFLLAFYIATHIQRASGHISPVEWYSFCCGPLAAREYPMPFPFVLPQYGAAAADVLDQLVPNFAEILQGDAQLWERSLTKGWPIPWDELQLSRQLSAFQRLLLVRLLAPHELHDAMASYIQNVLGARVGSYSWSHVEIISSICCARVCAGR